MEHLVALTQLLLNENKIVKIENLGSLRDLDLLDLSDNDIVKVENLGGLVQLSELWLTANKVESFEEFEHLRLLGNLKTVRVTQIYLERCPVYFYPDYQARIREVCPVITQIDSTYF